MTEDFDYTASRLSAKLSDASKATLSQLDIVKKEVAKRDFKEQPKTRLYSWIVLMILLTVQISN